MPEQVDFSFATPTGALTPTRAGKPKALAATTAERLFALKEGPAVAESACKDFAAEDCKTVVAPVGTPIHCVKAKNETVNAAPGKAEVRALLAVECSPPQGGTPEQLDAFLKSEQAGQAQAVHPSGATVD